MENEFCGIQQADISSAGRVRLYGCLQDRSDALLHRSRMPRSATQGAIRSIVFAFLSVLPGDGRRIVDDEYNNIVNTRMAMRGVAQDHMNRWRRILP